MNITPMKLLAPAIVWLALANGAPLAAEEAAPAAAAQVEIHKKDGTVVTGTIVEEDLDYMVVRTAEGQDVRIKGDDIEKVETPDPDRSATPELEGAGTKTKRPAANNPALTHQKEWPRDPATPLEEKVWALGPRVRYDANEAAAKELAAIQDEGYLALFEELLFFDYAQLPLEQDDESTLWRRTLSSSIGVAKQPEGEELGRKLAASDDPRQRYDACMILRNYPTARNAELLHKVFLGSLKPIPMSKRPNLQDILIANEEGFEEAIADLNDAYEQQPGLALAAETALKDFGLLGIEAAGKGLGRSIDESRRATIYLISRLARISDEERKRYGYRDADVLEIQTVAARALVPHLEYNEHLPDTFFAIVELGEVTYPFLIDNLKRSEQKNWAGVTLRRMSGHSLPANYERWREWYKERYGK